VPCAQSRDDIVEAIKTVNLVKSAAQMLRRELPVRVVLTAVQPGTNVAEHIEKEVAKAELPLLDTRLNRLVAFQELSFTGIPPTTGLAGIQCANFLYDVQTLGALPETAKTTS
jgi:chromosome partitioning protein